MAATMCNVARVALFSVSETELEGNLGGEIMQRCRFEKFHAAQRYYSAVIVFRG